ncbi:RRQRL motif-containing zinc-binding protein [Streptomyces sp. NPDC056549]|uniref:RRQRL motif-containing zinc-binding protein n=1 Tax=Streptomyces sp. NPDC056549 TaxID=3345864 RepID=UPI0036C52CA7
MLEEFDRRACPEGLVTRRQLRALELSPGGHGPVAVLRCKGCSFRPDQACIHPTRAWLYSLAFAQPKRTPTLAQEEALDRAMAARSTCPQCRRRYHFCLPLRTQGRLRPLGPGLRAEPQHLRAVDVACRPTAGRLINESPEGERTHGTEPVYPPHHRAPRPLRHPAGHLR